MNWLHRYLCRSRSWRKTVQERVPWVLAGFELGPDVLEIGPGPGLTTDLLRHSVERLTAIELDSKLADSLRSRFRGSNVEIVAGDATAMRFPDTRFSGVVSFTMLHHVPSVDLQDQLLREVCRVLKPGGFFLGIDSMQSFLMRIIHIGDTLVPIDPNGFAARLESAGFEAAEIAKNADAFRFSARRPRQIEALN